MTATIVVDASFITSLLAQSEGATKDWALAERLDAPLVTLDQGLTRAADAQCQFVLPPQ